MVRSQIFLAAERKRFLLRVTIGLKLDGENLKGEERQKLFVLSGWSRA